MKSLYEVRWVVNNSNTVKHHGTFETYEEAYLSITHWWELNNFKPPYVRSWCTDEKVAKIDYGFHDFFYHIVEIPLKGIAIHTNDKKDSIAASLEEFDDDTINACLQTFATNPYSGKMKSTAINLSQSEMRELGSWLLAMSQL